MKIIGASLALAAMVCLIIGCWTELNAGFAWVAGRMKGSKCKVAHVEAADYADDELYE
jgi:hypothetical protein